MKKLLGIVVLGLLLSGNVYSEIDLIEKKKIDDTTVSTLCIDGFKYAMTSSNNGVSIVQVFKFRGQDSFPMTCKNK